MVCGPSKTELLARMLPPCVSPDAVDGALGAALRLSGIVHLEDPADAVELVAALNAEQAKALPYVFAALVEIDKTPGELLAWIPGYQAPKRLSRVTAVAPASVLLDQPKARQHDAQCGTHKGHERHLRGGEPVDVECGIAEDAWVRTAPPVRPKRRRKELQAVLFDVAEATHAA